MLANEEIVLPLLVGIAHLPILLDIGNSYDTLIEDAGKFPHISAVVLFLTLAHIHK